MVTQARPQPPAALRDLRSWLSAVEAIGELTTIEAEVDPIEEMSGIAYLVSRTEHSRAVLFSNVKGSAPGVQSLFCMVGASRRRLAITLGLTENDDLLAMVQELRSRLERRIPPVIVGAHTAPINEVTVRGDDVDVMALAPPRQWPLDGGRYIGTGDVVISRDPDLGILNVGTYRLMVHDRNHVGVCINPGRDIGRHVAKAWERGEALPVAAVVGVHPLWLAIGGQKFPSAVSELDVIGGITGDALEMVEAGQSDLLIPANAEIVLEGYIEPGAIRPDGPFGEFTGYYGAVDEESRVMTVTAIRHRRSPILTNAIEAEYPTNETALLGAVARSAKLWDDLDRIGLPGVRGVWAHPAAANAKGLAVVSVEQRYPGHAAQALALAAQAPATAYYTKWIVAVDEDVDPTNMNEVVWAMSTRCSPVDDLDLVRQTLGSPQDPSVFPLERRVEGSKALINACKPFRHLSSFPRRMALDRRTWERIADRWSSDLGLAGAAPKPWLFAEEKPQTRT
jgi:4-hydroxy-3-polyprenylbenzoate decarboxylase